MPDKKGNGKDKSTPKRQPRRERKDRGKRNDNASTPRKRDELDTGVVTKDGNRNK